MVYSKRNAITHLKKSLEINPEFLPALYLLCETYLDKNNDDLVDQCLNSIKAIDPKNPRYLLLNSKIAFKKGDILKAKQFVDDCLIKKHYDKEILKQGLQIAKTLKSNKYKITIIESWLLHHDADVSLYLDLAKSLNQPNHYEKASYYFQIAHELAPENVDVLIDSARFHSNAKQELSDGTIVSKKDYKKAKAILRKALTIQKDCKDAICMLGEISFDEQEFSIAKKYFNHCYKANYKRDSYLLKLAAIAEASSQYRLHEKLVIEASFYKKLAPEAFAELLNIKLKQSKNPDTLSVGIKAIKHYRRKIRFVKNEISRFLKHNLFIESRDLAQELKMLTNKLANVYYQFSELQKNKNRKEKYLDEALRMDSNHVEANFQKALILKTTKSLKCLDYFKKCFDNSWYHWRARWEYICLNEKKMPLEEKKSFLKIICEAEPSHKKARIKLNSLISANS